MNNSQSVFTIPSMSAQPGMEVDGGLVFQIVSSEAPDSILSFTMPSPSYHRKSLRYLIRFPI